MATLLVLSLLGCGGGSDSSSCNASFDLIFPDGSQAAMDVCEQIEAVGAFEFDPDDPPEFRSTTLKLSSSAEVDNDCWFQISLNGICDVGRYEIGTGSEMSWATNDCSGIPDEYEAQYVASTGAIDLTLASAGDELGTPEETTVTAFLAGNVDVVADDGTGLSGSFDLVQDFTWTDTEDRLCTEQTLPTDTGPVGPGILSVSVSALRFGSVSVDTVAVESLLLANVGEGDLFIEAIDIDEPAWSWRGNSVPRVINPGQSSTVYVDFSPTEAVEYAGSLVITSDDVETPEFVVELTGTGL